ncbi:MAG TPA: MFS transporter [Terracidiphilus sp.]|nr:MFS transporter [Terracidiphilus sp.]
MLLVAISVGGPIEPCAAPRHIRRRSLTAESAFNLNEISPPEIELARAHRLAGNRALRAAFIGFFVDMFDSYLPVVALGPAMPYFQPETLSLALQSTLFYTVFALSLVGRPVGAALFGHFSDKLGRRKVTLISMAGFAAVTFLIAMLPGYETWGVASIVLLTFLRFVDGVFLGGEYTGANPMAMEYAPREKRGEWSAFIHSGFPLSLAAMSLLTSGLLRVIPAGSSHSAYARWGWRIPFVLGALFACGVFLYCLRKVPESVVWAKAEKVKSPLKQLFRGENHRVLLQSFLVMSGTWFTLNAVTSILPGVLLTVRHVNSVTVTNAQLIENLIMMFLFVPFGMLGQRIGRRTVLWLVGMAGCTVGPLLYFVLVRSGYTNTVELIVLVTLINICATPAWAIITAYLNERFSTGVRASGYGISYSVATILPAFSSFYMLGLQRMGMPYEYTEVVIFALGGLLLMIGALSGPETNQVEIC